MPRVDKAVHKQKRRSSLPDQNAPAVLGGILSPELPSGVAAQKRNSQRTLSTLDDNSTIEEQQQHPTPPASAKKPPLVTTTPLALEDEEDNSSNKVSAANDADGFSSSGGSSGAGIFIPGITGKARCLSKGSSTAGENSLDASQQTEEAANRHVHSAVPPLQDEHASAARSGASRSTASGGGDDKQEDHHQQQPHSKALRRESYSDSPSIKSGFSSHASSTEDLEEALHLYDAVVESITSRHGVSQDSSAGTRSTASSGLLHRHGLQPDELRAMLQLLEEDTAGRTQQTSNTPTNVSLRDQVDSIRDLLNGYYDARTGANSGAGASIPAGSGAIGRRRDQFKDLVAAGDRQQQIAYEAIREQQQRAATQRQRVASTAKRPSENGQMRLHQDQEVKERIRASRSGGSASAKVPAVTLRSTLGERSATYRIPLSGGSSSSGRRARVAVAQRAYHSDDENNDASFDEVGGGHRRPPKPPLRRRSRRVAANARPYHSDDDNEAVFDENVATKLHEAYYQSLKDKQERMKDSDDGNNDDQNEKARRGGDEPQPAGKGGAAA